MTICVAQSRPVTGNVPANLDKHIALIKLGIANGASAIFFPELSLTGYEPTLARNLATQANDPQFNVFQQLSDASQIVIGVGMPTITESGICISLLLFQPHLDRQVYSKQYLHADEVPYFVSGNDFPGLTIGGKKIALAICYELSVPAHTANACSGSAVVYIASVAKTAGGLSSTLSRLALIARTQSIPVLMANCVGQADGDICAGTSSAWNDSGQLTGQLASDNEGLLLLNLATQEVTVKQLPH
ncbi:carbon-nitrogen hydrolase family protein [Fibrivirga algicola]|uniref:Carbon-nitrogen hydrolase family protein n=1 Tax=Fibrivirga algicola TaxID=2950420 RepID=A0ABX0QQE6_9BACT|nr:carbon-nitrogen hydrolase family protein [Fibrivirga algicola]NID12389.1 carbon-nitrogen hydrolase family protein [Fibrivirga algicola]